MDRKKERYGGMGRSMAPVRRAAGGRGAAATSVVVTLSVLALLGLAVVWFVWDRCGLRGCPDVELVRGHLPDEASVVLDRRGGEVTKLYRVRRTLVSVDSLPAYVPAAIVAVEDRRFWEHRGVDWRRVVGAAWRNLRSREIEEGFSTITMQLARNLFPEELPQAERTLSRKLAEMRVAQKIEREYGKREILELYLNQIYFGSGAWGIEAAAQEYFGKPASELTLGEAALLAGLPPAPSRWNPRVDESLALARRRAVLRRVVAQGQVTAADAERAASEPLELARGERVAGQVAPYFVEDVRQLLEEHLGESVYTGGYRIHTTLDPAVQEVAESELARQLRAVEAGRHGSYRHAAYGGAGYLQGAVVVLETGTGDVLALVGGRDFQDSKFNRATQARRQPGSAFKPVVYAAAVAAGYPPVHRLEDTPLRRVLSGGRVWTPRNYGGSYGGLITMRQALVQSKNVATVRLSEEVGLSRVLEMGRRLGIETPLPEVPAVSIGAGEVGVLELTAAYTVFATLGERVWPRLVTRVEDRDGRVVWEQRPRRERVLDPAAAFLVTDLLRDVVDRGTGRAVRAAGYGGVAAGKTGTTNEATDVWFIGFTPARVTGVWIGLDRPATILPRATGGGLAAPVWGRIMRRVGGGAPGGWSPPPGVEQRVVDAYGTVIAPECPEPPGARREYFLSGTAPHGRCADPGAYWPVDTLWLPRDTFELDTLRRLPWPPDTAPAERDTVRPEPRRAPYPPIDTVRLPPEERPNDRRDPEPDTAAPGTASDASAGLRRRR